jgi:hypothetical protein
MLDQLVGADSIFASFRLKTSADLMATAQSLVPSRRHTCMLISSHGAESPS